MPLFNNRKRSATKAGLSNAVRTAYGVGRAAYAGYSAYKKRKSVKTRFKPRRGGSRSKTKTKRRNTEKSWDRDGNGIAYKKATLTYKRSKTFNVTKMLTSLSRRSFVFAGGAISDQGLQNTTVVTEIKTPELITMFTALRGGVVIPATQASIVFNLNSILYEIEFSNSGPTAIEIDIHHMIDKQSGLVTLGTPMSIWGLGLADEVSTAPTTAQTPWLKPTAVKRFNLAYWTKTYSKSLSPGEKIKLTLRHNVNRVLDYQYLDQFQCIRGITSQVMVTQRGAICDGNQAFAVTALRQTLSRSKLIWLVKYTLEGQLLNSYPKINYTNSGLPGVLVTPLLDQSDGPAQPQNTEDPLEYA